MTSAQLWPLALVLAGLISAPSCGAARDPDLERRAAQAVARYQQEQVAAPPVTPPPAPAAATQTPVRTYSEQEIARILGRVPGGGTSLWAEFRTPHGTLKCRLDEGGARHTVTNFVALATGQVEWRDSPTGRPSREPFYDGLTFHRIVANFIIQTGNPGKRVGGGPGWVIPRETGGNGAFSEPGALAMVDSGDNSHGSQLFVTVRPDNSLSRRYAAFGACSPVDIVRTISNLDKLPAADGRAPTVPRDPVKIFKVQIYRGDG